MTKRKFLGLQYPLVKTPRGILAQKSGIAQIKADLLQLLLTNPGERCLVGNTLIPLVNGSEVNIKDLVGREPFWVYAFDIESNRVVASLATAHQTLKNAKLVRVTLDNEEIVECTEDHLWMLRDGTYCRADELKPDQSLMPLYRNKNTSGYERVYQPYLHDYFETHRCFIEGEKLNGVREVVHHKNLKKLDNCPDNLEWMTWYDHRELHKKIRNAFDQKIKNDPEFAKNWKEKQIAGLMKYYETHEGSRKGATLSEDTKKKLSDGKKAFYQTEEGKKVKEVLKEKALKQFADKPHCWKGKVHAEEFKAKLRGPRPQISGENNPSKRPEVREKLKEAWVKRRLKNHKVINVEHITKREDCYDLTVDKFHNFAISAGVFVHNCMLPLFGVPLKRLVFEPNDPSLEVEAKKMIGDAIEMWEPRIVIDQIEVTSYFSKDNLDRNDPGEDTAYILGIKILFYDPQNISEVNELKMEMPLGGG